jgi:hypothetical protein
MTYQRLPIFLLSLTLRSENQRSSNEFTNTTIRFTARRKIFLIFSCEKLFMLKKYVNFYLLRVPTPKLCGSNFARCLCHCTKVAWDGTGMDFHGRKIFFDFYHVFHGAATAQARKTLSDISAVAKCSNFLGFYGGLEQEGEKATMGKKLIKVAGGVRL